MVADKLWFFSSGSVSSPEELADSSVTYMPTDWTSAKYLDAAKQEYVLPENYISRQEYMAADQTGETIATRWWQHHSLAGLYHKEIPLGYLLEWELHITLAKFLKQLLDFNRMMEVVKPKTVIGTSGISMFAKLPEFIAKRHGITFKPAGSAEPEKTFHMDIIPVAFKVGSKSITLKLTQDQFKRLVKMINTLTGIVRLVGSSGQGKKLLMLDFNIVQYRPLLEGLEDAGFNLFLLNKRRPIVWNLASLKEEMRKKYQFGSIGDYVNGVTKKVVQNEAHNIQAVIEEAWKSEGVKNQFSFCGINFWDLIKDDLKKFCISRLTEAIEDIELASSFLDRNRFDMMIAWGYVLPFEKIMLMLGRQRKMVSLSIQHGVLANLRDSNGEWSLLESHATETDTIAAWGKSSKEWFVKNGIDASRVAEIGSPRYDSIFKYAAGAGNGNSILVATSGLPTSFAAYNTISVAKRYEEFLRKTCEAVKKLPDKNLVVKLHPFADEIIDVVSVVQEAFPNARIAKNESIVNLIKDSELLISTYTYSSVVLESMILGKPTMVFETLDRMLEPVELPYVTSGASMGIKEPEDIGPVLEKFFSDPSLREKLRQNSQNFVKGFLFNPGNSISVLSDYIAKKLD